MPAAATAPVEAPHACLFLSVRELTTIQELAVNEAKRVRGMFGDEITRPEYTAVQEHMLRLDKLAKDAHAAREAPRGNLGMSPARLSR